MGPEGRLVPIVGEGVLLAPLQSPIPAVKTIASRYGDGVWASVTFLPVAICGCFGLGRSVEMLPQ